MQTITSGEHTFEVVESVPKNYIIWNIGHHMINGYLPLVMAGGYDGCQVVGTMKAIKVDQAQTILAAIGRGQNTIEDMERYVKRYKNSKTGITQRHVKRLEAALKVMYTIKWD